MKPHHGTVEKDGRTIAFTAYGYGTPALILVHGWACHQGFWHRQIASLSHVWRVVTLDLAGHGGAAPLTLGRGISMSALAEDIVTVADELSLSDVILVGHSMGGFIALEAALRLGDRCRLLLGIDTFADAAFSARRSDEEIAARRAILAQGFPGAIANMVDTITLGGGRALKTWIAEEMGRVDHTVALDTFEAMLGWDIEVRWPLLRCRSETINSSLLSRGIETLSGLTGLQVHLMTDVGHFPMLEAPDTFAALVLDILRDYQRGER